MIHPLEKVRPRINHFDHKLYPYYVYVYLDPFDERQYKVKMPGEYLEFAYTPIYIGKATGSGFRHNQHVAEYVKTDLEQINGRTIHNRTKLERFKKLEDDMKHYGHTNVKYPRNWEEYQRDWVIVIKAFDNSHALVRYEAEAIRRIGTLRRETGPLINALLG